MKTKEQFEKYKKEYIEELLQNNKREKNLALSAALECALDTRRFEISLYWKRAAYFWAFITVIFATYFSFFTNEVLLDLADRKYYIFIVTIIGFIFSFCWILVNRGSKYWQQNWEMHVDFLEDEIMGSLYKTIKNPSNLTASFGLASSVSKINQLLSLIITLVWVFFIYNSLDDAFCLKDMFLRIIVTIVGSSVISFLILLFTKSSMPRVKGEAKKSPFISRYLS